jgi:N-methylhydantoinase A/oxoprolinase/acetone carboxylase beta subunit
LDQGNVKIDQITKILLLGAIQSRSEQLSLLLEESAKKKVDAGVNNGQFNPISFGPGAALNQPGFVKNLENLDIAMGKEATLNKEIELLETQKAQNITKKEQLEDDITRIEFKTETEQELALQKLENDKSELKLDIQAYEDQFTQLEAELKQLEEANQTLVQAL